MAPVTGRAHDRDDLLDARRIGRIAASLVPWRTAGVEARQGGRRPPTTGGVEQDFAHDSSSGATTRRSLSRQRSSSAPRKGASRLKQGGGRFWPPRHESLAWKAAARRKSRNRRIE